MYWCMCHVYKCSMNIYMLVEVNVYIYVLYSVNVYANGRLYKLRGKERSRSRSKGKAVIYNEILNGNK